MSKLPEENEKCVRCGKILGDEIATKSGCIQWKYSEHTREPPKTLKKEKIKAYFDSYYSHHEGGSLSPLCKDCFIDLVAFLVREKNKP